MSLKIRSSIASAAALLAVAVTSPVVTSATILPTNKVPDTGSTALMFGGAVLVALMLRRRVAK